MPPNDSTPSNVAATDSEKKTTAKTELEKLESCWNDSAEEHFVMFADIMGFRQRLIDSKSHKDFVKRFKIFDDTLKKQSKPLMLGGGLKMTTFSDSIILVTSCCDKDALNRIAKAAIRLVQIGMKHGFPISAAIARGFFTHEEENNFSVGQALVDAYELQSQLFFYGIALHHSMTQDIEEYGSSNPFHKVPIPLKSGVANHCILSWHRLKTTLSSGDITKDAFQWLDKIEEPVSGRPRVYVQNTRDVIERVNELYPYPPQKHL